MSLLEDVFLEDEAGEAQELERIIEGDDYDERPRPTTPNSNENSEKEDEAEEDKRHVDPSSAKPKRIVKNPRVVLNPARLTGPRGIQVIPEHYKDFVFKGKGHEKEDLDLVLKKLEHWAYRLFPKFEFKDCLKKIETLGNKRPVVVHLTKIRTDQFISEETVVQRDSSEDEAPPEPIEDEFDKLLQQQIELARATPAPGTAKVERSLIMPKATSSPSINDEQRERMLRNRQLAEERRLARLRLNNSETGHERSTNNTESNDELGDSNDRTIIADSRNNIISKNDSNGNPIEKIAANAVNTTLKLSINGKDIMPEAEENITRVKHNRSNVIDSSDSEDDALVINESVTVDVHNHRNYDSDEGSDMICQDENDKEINSDKVHQNKSAEINSDIVYQSENKQESEIYQQNKNTKVEEIRDDTNDVEMNNIDNSSESESSKNEELGEFNKIVTNSENNDIDIDEVTNNKNDSEILQSNDNSTLVSKEISKHSNMETVLVQSIANTEEAKKNTETAIAYVEDIMNVDFSDDF